MSYTYFLVTVTYLGDRSASSDSSDSIVSSNSSNSSEGSDYCDKNVKKLQFFTIRIKQHIFVIEKNS